MSQPNVSSDPREVLSLIDTRTQWAVTIGLYVFVDTWLTHYALTQSVFRELNPLVAYVYYEIQFYDHGKFMLMILMKSLSMSAILILWSKGLREGWQKSSMLVIMLIIVSSVVVWNIIQLTAYWV